MSFKKSILLSTFLTSIVLPLSAETLARAIVISGGRSDEVLLTKASKTQLFYKNRARDTADRTIDRNLVSNVYFFRTESYQRAFEAYAKGEFKIAKELFKGCKEEFATFDSIPGDYSSLSAYYEMECARRLGDLEASMTLFKSFRPEKLINESQRSQLEIYSIWENVSAESWDKVLTLARLLEKKKLPGYQQAQISYCQGLAYQGKGEKDQAIAKYNEGIALSEFREPELIENASEKIIDILLQNEKVGELLKKAGKIKEENKFDQAYQDLKQASALALVWDSLTNQTRDLPSKYKKLLKVK